MRCVISLFFVAFSCYQAAAILEDFTHFERSKVLVVDHLLNIPMDMLRQEVSKAVVLFTIR